jgi:serine/threonine protein kinase
MTDLTFTKQHLYKILQIRYEGESTSFLEAFDAIEQRKVGIKKVKVSRQNLTIAEQEAKVLHKLSTLTTYVPALYITHYDETSEIYYLIMQLIEGGITLAEQLKYPIPLSIGLDYAIKLCDVISDIHKCKIQHRDLKPQNIIVKKNQVHLIDFNLSVMKPVNGQGTPVYQAPEQHQRLGVIGWDHIDMFAFGIVLYEILSGSAPKWGVDYSKHYTEPRWSFFHPPSSKKDGLPASLDAIVMKCLEYQPKQRYSDMQQVKQALIQVKRGIR